MPITIITPEETVKALRKACNGCSPTPCCEFEVLGKEAADLIESLTARAEKAEADYKTADECLENMYRYIKSGMVPMSRKEISRYIANKRDKKDG